MNEPREGLCDYCLAREGWTTTVNGPGYRVIHENGCPSDPDKCAECGEEHEDPDGTVRFCVFCDPASYDDDEEPTS